MKVAIPTWNERVSPVFESAATFVVLELESRRQKTRAEAHLTETLPLAKVRWLVDHNIDVLICGAIARSVSDLVIASGISLVPWVCGEIDAVIEAFQANALPHPDFTMPGCCGRRLGARHRRGRGNGRGAGVAVDRGMGKRTHEKEDT